MSRHEFEQPGVQVAIGWDAPLATFYLQVWAEELVTAETDEEEREAPQIWLGTEYGEFPGPSTLLALARRFLPDLPGDLEETLDREKREKPARPLAADHGAQVRLLEALLGGASPDTKRGVRQ